jgi:uncharacterized protein DUF6152
MTFPHFKRALLAGSLWIGLTPWPVAAHHSFSAAFDGSKKITLAGVVTRIEWENPHTYFYLDVRKNRGSAVTWICQAAGPNSLFRLGWNRESVKIGDMVTVVGYPARGGANVASARLVILASGQKVLAGSPADGGPQP